MQELQFSLNTAVSSHSFFLPSPNPLTPVANYSIQGWTVKRTRESGKRKSCWRWFSVCLWKQMHILSGLIQRFQQKTLKEWILGRISSLCFHSGGAFHLAPVLVAVRRGRVNPGLKTCLRYFTTKAEGPLHSKYCRAGGEGAGWIWVGGMEMNRWKKRGGGGGGKGLEHQQKFSLGSQLATEGV